MQNFSQPFPKTSTRFRHEGTRKPANNQRLKEKEKKAVCIIGEESVTETKYEEYAAMI